MDEFFVGVREIPNIHPIVVNCPIALLTASLVFDLLGLGTLAAPRAVYTGHSGEDVVHAYVSDKAGAILNDTGVVSQFDSRRFAVPNCSAICRY